MLVKEVMKTNIVVIDENESCKKAAKLLLENKISGAPVVGENNKLVGIISEKDIFRSLFPAYRDFYSSPESYLDFESREKRIDLLSRSAKVSQVMAQRLITATPDTPILKVGAQMVASGIHRVPVLENGQLIGIVSRRDIYRAIMREYMDMWDVEEKKIK